MCDTTDKKYQASAEFKPDKESTWTFPSQHDGWVHAHNALRGELTAVREALVAVENRRIPLEEWEINALKRVTSAHFEHIHAHHSNEDDLFVPELRKRINFPEKLVTDHIGLVEKLEELENIINNIKVGDLLHDSNLLQQWITYQEMMLPHLKEEEDIGLPLMRAYYTPKDIAPIVQKLVAKSPTIEIGSMIYFMGVDRCRNEFMKQEGIPGFVWYVDFKFKYKYFVKEFVHNVDALRSGVKTIAEKAWWRFFL
jgi:hemerythrin-like domain-containing protein